MIKRNPNARDKLDTILHSPVDGPNIAALNHQA